jgi:hypothetical protein
MTTEPANELVTISVARLRELEALEASLPEVIAKAKTERDKERLLVLHEKQKSNPEPNRTRVLANYHKNKEEVNAKRREAYRLKKEAEAKAVSPA